LTKRDIRTVYGVPEIIEGTRQKTMAAPQLDRFNASTRLYEISCHHLAGGVSSGMRGAYKPLPLFFEQAAGSRLRDVDGHEYIDYTLAWGPMILGHSHPAIVAAVQE
jgi:glutamate-1-semialdehyde 2,1-aminomutase